MIVSDRLTNRSDALLRVTRDQLDPTAAPPLPVGLSELAAALADGRAQLEAGDGDTGEREQLYLLVLAFAPEIGWCGCEPAMLTRQWALERCDGCGGFAHLLDRLVGVR